MKRNLTILCMVIISVFHLNSQNVTFEGHVTDNEKNDLIAATVRCLAGDSIYIKGVTTNNKGEFKLEVPQTDKPRRLIFNYLGYKELILSIQPTKEHTVRLGDIVMQTDVVVMHEVTVLGENQVRTEDKLMAYPTKEELRHAYDGYSALDAMMIPALNVNTFNNTISYMNQNVLLCINGREATQQEVCDLNAKDIMRVDLYPMGKPEFPQAGAVIDYIMKACDYAGTTSFNARHHLTRPEGNGTVSTQYFHGKSEFAISASGRYNNYEWEDEGQVSTTYNLPDESVTRSERLLPSKNNALQLNGYINYIYRDKRQDFYASLRMNHSDSEEDDWSNLQYSNATTVYTKQENEQMKQLNPGLKLQYTRTLSHNRRLRAELYGSYGKNDYERWYEHRKDETVTDTYRNSTAEKSYYAKGKVNYTKVFKDKSSFNLDLTQDFTHTNNQNLRGENIYNVSLDKSNTRLNATYSHRIKNRFNLQARLSGHLAHVETAGNEVTNVFFTPSIRLSYMYKKHSFDLQGQATSKETGISDRTGDEYRNNEYEITQGNPELKDYMNYNFLLGHTWNISKNFTWLCYAKFDLNTNYIYKKCEYDAARNALIWKVQNSGTNWLQHYEAAIQWNIVPKRLIVRAGILYNYSKINVWETLYHHGLYATGAIMYQYKGFRALASVLTAPESIDSQTGRIIHTPTSLSMNVSYSINNWNFSLAYQNPYKAKARAEMELGVYQLKVTSRRPHLSDNYGTFSVSYRFSYGKKKHKFDDSEVIDINQSTISR